MTTATGSKMKAAVLVLWLATVITAGAQSFQSLFTFDGDNGAVPEYAPLVQGPDGQFYGTTYLGGLANVGSVFKITADGELTALYSFCKNTRCTDGAYPLGLVEGTDGSFYGTTVEGGPSRYGTVYRITPDGELTTLYAFCATGERCVDGAAPNGGLVRGVDGDFYGVTSYGGSYNQGSCFSGCGTIFRISAQGVLATLHRFGGYPVDGDVPRGALVQGPDGNFYGTTTAGGNNDACNLGCGTVFSMSPGGSLTIMHSFDLNPDGEGPPTGVVLGLDGSLYGITFSGGAYNGGTAFRITRAGAFSVIYAFCSKTNCSDGRQPYGLTVGTDGDLYGITIWGGRRSCSEDDGCGTIFRINPQDHRSPVYQFCRYGSERGCAQGFWPMASLTQGTDGKFYGTTSSGGDLLCNFGLGFGCGTVFSLDLGLGPFVRFVFPAGRVGEVGGILGQGLTATTSVAINGVPASFKVVSDTYLTATVPAGATTGYVTVTTPTEVLTSNVPFDVIQ